MFEPGHPAVVALGAHVADNDVERPPRPLVAVGEHIPEPTRKDVLPAQAPG